MIDILYRVLPGPQDGPVKLSRATANATVTRVIVKTLKAGQITAGLAAIERKTGERAA